MKKQAGTSTASPRPTDKKIPTRSNKKGNGPVVTGVTGIDSVTTDRDEKIRQTAYFLYESRSCEGGHELDDWLQAEAQIANPVPLGAPLSGR
jgi:hypothetical protein